MPSMHDIGVVPFVVPPPPPAVAAAFVLISFSTFSSVASRALLAVLSCPLVWVRVFESSVLL